MYEVARLAYVLEPSVAYENAADFLAGDFRKWLTWAELAAEDPIGIDDPEHGVAVRHYAERIPRHTESLARAVRREEWGDALKYALLLGFDLGQLLAWSGIDRRVRQLREAEPYVETGKRVAAGSRKAGLAKRGKSKVPKDVHEQYLHLKTGNPEWDHASICACIARRAGLSTRRIEQVMQHSPHRKRKKNKPK